VLLKLTVPGVPDVYQGTELWAFTLVDPDNRRAVDYERRAQLLEEIRRSDEMSAEQLRKYVGSLFDHIADGRIKLYFTWRALSVRRRFDAVFRLGHYQPLRATGSQLDSVCAFSRSYEGTEVLIVVSRWFARLRGGNGLPHGVATWQDTRIDVPREGGWTNVLTGERVSAEHSGGQTSLALAQVFATLPWALLVPGED